MRYGLLIQGPIISPGYGPYEFNASGDYVKNWILYDSRVNIEEIIRGASLLFDVIVVSTWKDAANTDFLSRIKTYQKVQVVEVEQTDFLKEKEREGSHKYHQLFTTQAGATALRAAGCQTIAKIRTDHSLNLEVLHGEVLRHQKRNSRSLGVPNLNLYEIDRLTDFFFICETNLIIEMCNNYFLTPEIFADTHKDYFYKFANFLGGDKYLTPKRNVPFLGLRLYISNVGAWTEVFYPLNAKLFKDFYWRGRKVNHRINGWIRWFFVFKAKSKATRILSFGLNLFLLSTVKSAKKPFIRITSKYVYIRYRNLARRQYSLDQLSDVVS